MFVSAGLDPQLEDIAKRIASEAPGIPTALVCGAGVLSERGEIEDRSAATGLVFSGGQVELVVVDGDQPADVGDGLARALSDRSSRTVAVFCRGDGFAPELLDPLAGGRHSGRIFGAGAVGETGVYAVHADGSVATGGAIAMFAGGLGAPQIRTSPAARIISPLHTISEVRGPMVVELDGRPALERLAAVGEHLADQPLVLAALAAEDGATQTAAGRPPLVLRGLRGVDPAHQSIAISSEVRVGMRMAFAIRDPRAARTDLEAVVRELDRDIAGAAPRFALYLNCAGRGSQLYGNPDVDTKILKSRLGNLPIAGMNSAFEIAPLAGDPMMHLYTGVVALFVALS